MAWGWAALAWPAQQIGREQAHGGAARPSHKRSRAEAEWEPKVAAHHQPHTNLESEGERKVPKSRVERVHEHVIAGSRCDRAGEGGADNQPVWGQCALYAGYARTQRLTPPPPANTAADLHSLGKPIGLKTALVCVFVEQAHCAVIHAAVVAVVTVTRKRQRWARGSPCPTTPERTHRSAWCRLRSSSTRNICLWWILC